MSFPIAKTPRFEYLILSYRTY